MSVLPFPARTMRPPDDDKVRDGFVLLHGRDVPDEVVDRITRIVAHALNSEPTEFMVSGVDAEIYDYFAAECE